MFVAYQYEFGKLNFLKSTENVTHDGDSERSRVRMLQLSHCAVSIECCYCGLFRQIQQIAQLRPKVYVVCPGDKLYYLSSQKSVVLLYQLLLIALIALQFFLYPDWGFLLFTSVSPGKCHDINIDLGHDLCRTIASKLIIHCFIV